MRASTVFGLVCATLVGAMLATAGRAADLDPEMAPPQAYGEPDPQFEFGTGWYLRGDVGYSDSSREQLFGDLPALTTSKTDWTGGIGAGYRWNSWLRTDLTLNYEGFQHMSAGYGVTNQICPYALRGLNAQDANSTAEGYLWSTQAGTCSGKQTGDLLKTDVMVGGYIDIGTWAGITPYVGAGVGFARVDTWNSISYNKNSDGTVYKANLTDSGGYPLLWINEADVVQNAIVPTTGLPVAFAQQNWSKSSHMTKYNFAWALMGGVSYALDDHLSIDLGYRYVNLGTYRDASNVSKTLDAQQVRIGMRYAID